MKKIVQNILWYKEVVDETIPYIGEKAGCFAKLSLLGLPVPPGFVISSILFESFLHNSGLAIVIEQKLTELNVEDIQQLEIVSKEIQDLILKTNISHTLLEEIFEAYDALQIDLAIRGTKAEDFVKSGRELSYVSVRGSGIVGLKVNPYASYLHVKGYKMLVAAIKACWASFFTPRALYHQIGDRHKPIRVAVLIQKMVTPDVSGIVHLQEQDAKVQATYGLGLSVLEAGVSKDLFKVNTSSFDIENKNIAKKEWSYFYDSRENRHIKKNIMEADQEVPCLSGYEIRKVIEHSKTVIEMLPMLNEVGFCVQKGKVFLTSLGQTNEQETESVEQNKFEKEERIKESDIQDNPVILIGKPVCSGVAQGKIRILRNLQDEDKVKPGEILLMRSGLSDFTPAMCRAGAIIVDEPDPQHYIVRTARELRIPCLVGTENAMDLLIEDEHVTVDARTGEIFRGLIQDKIINTLEKERGLDNVSVIKAELLLSGIGVSPGIARGKIKFVREISHIAKIQAGDVVVLRKWNKDFSRMLDKSSAILIDSDENIDSACKMFVHTKTPAIIGTDIALLKLREGEVVTVEGNKGRVYKGKVEFN